MKADTFAKLIVLDALIEAEIGYYLEHRPASAEAFREALVARISDLIDEIDVLDSVAAGRAYDAIVDFLAELPEDDDGMVDAVLRFRRAVDRIIDRGIDRRDQAAASTWAVVLEELLSELADEYHLAIAPDSEVRMREYHRAEALLGRVRQAADRMLWRAEVPGSEIFEEVDRLTYAVRHRRMRPTAVDYMIRSLQRRASKYRPSTITRVGAFVLRQLIGRESKPRAEKARRPRDRRVTGERRRSV